MELYSGAGLENFDGHDLKGVVVDVLSAIGTVRSDYSALMELFSAVPGLTLAGTDAEAVEVFLADNSKREEFYKRLCNFGRSLNLVLNSEKTYEALAVEEREKYIKAFGFFSAVRRSVKPRYGDSIDNREYEPLMQNLLDVHLSVEGLKRITEPVDILDRDAFEKELNELAHCVPKLMRFAHGSPRVSIRSIRRTQHTMKIFPSASRKRWSCIKPGR